MDSTKFRWIGEGRLARVKGTLSKPKDRQTYSSFQIGELVVSVNDFVYIRNFDATSRVNCFVGRVLDLYEKDEIEKGEDGDHNRAVVQWYCRVSDVAKKHYEKVAHYPESQLPEMIKDCRPYHNDIDVETIFDLCKVVEIDPYLENEDELAETDERMFVVRWKYDGKVVDAVKKTASKAKEKDEEGTSVNRRVRKKGLDDASAEGKSDGPSKRRRRAKEDSDGEQQDAIVEKDSAPPENDQGEDTLDGTINNETVISGRWRIKKSNTFISDNVHKAGDHREAPPTQQGIVPGSPKAPVLTMKLEKLSALTIERLQGSPAKQADTAAVNSIVESTPKRANRSAQKKINVVELPLDTSDDACASDKVTSMSKSQISGENSGIHKKAGNALDRARDIRDTTRKGQGSSNDPDWKLSKKWPFLGEDSSDEMAELKERDTRSYRKINATGLGHQLKDETRVGVAAAGRLKKSRTFNKPRLKYSIGDFSGASESSDHESSDDNISTPLKSTATTPARSIKKRFLRGNLTSNSGIALKNDECEHHHRGDRAKKKLLMDDYNSNSDKIDIENCEEDNDSAETTDDDVVGHPGSLFPKIRKRLVLLLAEKGDGYEPPNIDNMNRISPSENKIAPSKKSLNGAKRLKDSDSDVISFKLSIDKPGEMSSPKKLMLNESARKKAEVNLVAGKGGTNERSRNIRKVLSYDSKTRLPRKARGSIPGMTLTEDFDDDDSVEEETKLKQGARRHDRNISKNGARLSRSAANSKATKANKESVTMMNDEFNDEPHLSTSRRMRDSTALGIITRNGEETRSSLLLRKAKEDLRLNASPATPKRQLPIRSTRVSKKLIESSEDDGDSDSDPKIKARTRNRTRRYVSSDSASSDSDDPSFDEHEIGSEKSSDDPNSSDEEEDVPKPSKRTGLRRKPLHPSTPSALRRKTKKTKQEATPHLPNRQEAPSTPAAHTLEEVRARLHAAAIPDSLPCRDQQFEEIYRFVEGKILQGAGGCMYISGVPGTGKTATVNEVLRNLKENSEAGQIPRFISIKLNGMKMTDPQQAYVQFYKKLTGKKVTAAHARELLEKSFDKKKDAKAIVLLADELDLLLNRKQDVLYNFFDWPNRPRSQLVVLAIANTMDLPERILKNRVASRVGLTRMTFQPYTFKQLQEILSDRMGDEGMFHPDALQLVARKVAALSGDARRALGICRRATEIVAQTPQSPTKGKGIVNMTHVTKAIEEIFANPKIMALRHSSLQERTFMSALVNEFERKGVEEAIFSDVYRQHCNICRIEGYYTPNVSDAMAICSRLGSSKLLILEHGKTDIRQKIRLNMSVDDVLYALAESD